MKNQKRVCALLGIAVSIAAVAVAAVSVTNSKKAAANVAGNHDLVELSRRGKAWYNLSGVAKADYNIYATWTGAPGKKGKFSAYGRKSWSQIEIDMSRNPSLCSIGGKTWDKVGEISKASFTFPYIRTKKGDAVDEFMYITKSIADSVCKENGNEFTCGDNKLEDGEICKEDKVFEFFDFDNNGRIGLMEAPLMSKSISELYESMKRKPPAAVNRDNERYNFNFDDTISALDWLIVMQYYQSEGSQYSKIRKRFNNIDRDGNGAISLAESMFASNGRRGEGEGEALLEQAIDDLGYRAMLKKLRSAFGADENGVVTLENARNAVVFDAPSALQYGDSQSRFDIDGNGIFTPVDYMRMVNVYNEFSQLMPK